MKKMLLTIGPALDVVFVTPLARPKVGDPATLTFRAVGASGQVQWTLVATNLPSEWNDTLAVTGADASLATAQAVQWGTFFVTIRISDSTRASAQKTFAIAVRPDAVLISPTNPTYTWEQDVVPSDTLTVTGGTGDYPAAGFWDANGPTEVAPVVEDGVIRFTGAPVRGGYWPALKVYARDTVDQIGISTMNLTVPRKWRLVSPLPIPAPFGLSNVGVCVLRDGRVFVSGGRVGANVSGACFLYDPVADSWTNAAPFPSVWGFPALQQWGHDCYLLESGDVLMMPSQFGNIGAPMIYSPRTDRWRQPDFGKVTVRAGMAGGRLAFGSLLFAGGVDRETNTPGVDAFVVENTGEGPVSTTPLPSPQAGAVGIGVPNGRAVYMFGGQDGRSPQSPRVIAYEIGVGGWQSKSDMHISRGGHAVAGFSGASGPKIAVVGGDGDAWHSIEIYDPIADAFSQFSAPTIDLVQHCAVSYEDGQRTGVLAISGASGKHTVVFIDEGGVYPDAGLVVPVIEHSAVRLHDGSVLVIGGITRDGSWTPAVQRFL